MAQFPYLVIDTFDNGATTGTKTDTQSKGSYPHYSTMAKQFGVVPWRGAYSFLLNLSTGTATTDCYITYAAADCAANTYWSVGFALYLKNIVMSNTSRHGLARCMAGATVETSLDLLYTTAAGLQLCFDETGAGTTVTLPIEQNRWHWIELYGVNDPGANNGTANLVLNGLAAGSLSSLDQGAFTDLLIGAVGPDAGTTGQMFFDDVQVSGTAATEVRIGYQKRFPWSIHLSSITTASRGTHLFVGPGTVRRLNLLTTNSGDAIALYDTDTANTTAAYPTLVAQCQTATGLYEFEGPWQFERGCYAVVTAVGANGARAIAHIDPSPPYGYHKTIYYQNEAALKTYAIYGRKNSPPDIV